MSFVTPALLAGGLLVAIPIALHLVMRQQPQHRMFPALRFLTARSSVNRRNLRLRHLVLLALRCAAIGLMALALARPRVQGTGRFGSQEAPVASVFLFDTSARMDYRHQNETRIEAAQQLAHWLVKQLPPDSELAVVTSRGDSPVFAVDLGTATSRIERLRITPDARPIIDSLAPSLELLRKSEQPRKELYVFTDLARTGWPEDRAQELQTQLQADDGIALYVIDVGVEQPSNLGLAAVRLSSQTLAKNSPLYVSTELIRSGPATHRSVELFLVDDQGNHLKRGHESVASAEEHAQQISFPPIRLEEGIHQGFVGIVGQDGLAWDDRQFFTIEVKPAWRVLVARPINEPSIFFTEALAPESIRNKGQARFACDVVDLRELADASLVDYAAVCLLNPTPLGDSTWEQLASFVESGKSLAVFLGRNANPVDSFNQPAAQALLAGPLKRRWRESTYLTSASLQHPALEKFRALEGSIPWQAFPVDTFWQLGTLAEGANAFMRFTSGHPALVDRPVGKGHVLTMTTPVSDPLNLPGQEPWNVLPTAPEAWPFVMLMDGVMRHLVGNRHERTNYLSGDTVVLRLDADQRATRVLLETPLGDYLKQTVDPQENSIVVTSAFTPGNYRARAGGGNQRIDRGFSVNLDPGTMQLERITEDELVERLGEGRFQLARSRQEIDRRVNLGRVGRELFPFLIVAVALVLASEHFLSNRFYRDRP